MNRRRRLLVRGSLAGMALAGVAVAFWLVGQYHPSGYTLFPKCTFFAATGWHCIGCGLTRSTHAWLNGDVSQAMAYHPLSFVLLPYVLWNLLIGLWRWVWGEDDLQKKRWRLPSPVVWTFVVLLIVFWVVRNIPVYPFTLLAPHELTPSPAG